MWKSVVLNRLAKYELDAKDREIRTGTDSIELPLEEAMASLHGTGRKVG